MMEAKRYAVRKESGSRYAFIVDTHYNDERLYRYDVLKGDGWGQAEEKCKRMNQLTERLAARQTATEE